MKIDPHPKEIPILLEKRIILQYMLSRLTNKINECELVSDTDQLFNEITNMLPGNPNMLSHTEDTSSRYNNSKSQFKQSKINNSTISKLENYVDQNFNEAAMKYLKYFVRYQTSIFRRSQSKSL